jgi:hypothetical protein
MNKENTFKKGNPAICVNMDESEGHVKWNKPDWERQILHDLTYKWNLKKLSSEAKLEWRQDVEGDGKILVSGGQAPVRQDG